MKPLCELCAQNHSETFKDHGISKIEDCELICHDHKDPYEYVCTECNILICSKCLEDDNCSYKRPHIQGNISRIYA